MTTEPRCRACQLPLPPDAAACPRCGLEVGEAALPKPVPKPMPPTVRDFRRPTSRPEEMTQIVELPAGALLPHETPDPVAPPPPGADRRAIALAIGLGLLTGALVILLIAGIVRSHQSQTPAARAANP